MEVIGNKNASKDEIKNAIRCILLFILFLVLKAIIDKLPINTVIMLLN